jgi:apolipoprotein N-acyltransferase
MRFINAGFADWAEGRKPASSQPDKARYSGGVKDIMQRFPKAVCLMLGLASATGFEPLNLWFVMLAAFAGLMALVQSSPNIKAALARGYWFGVGHFVVGLNWIAGSFQYQETMPVWLGWIAVVALSLYLAVFPALAAGFAKRLGGRTPTAFSVFFACGWIVTEWMRATVFTGFAWNPLGVAALAMGGGATIIGTYGLSGLMLLAAGAAYVSANGLRVNALLMAILPGFALLATFVEVPEPDQNPTLPLLRVVQPNIGQQDKYEPAYDALNFQKLESLSGTPGATPRLILWPEAAIPDYLEQEEWARARVASLIGQKDMLLTGGTALIFDKKNELVGARNSLFALTPGAEIIGRYDKSHLVPYGEYLALRWLLEPLGATRLVPGDIDFIPGPGAQTLTLPGFGKVGVQICYEIIFSGQVIDAKDRPDFLFNPSNDAWFGTWGPPQHLAQARLRAIEEGLPIVRSTPTGISAIIDADGRIVKSLPYRKAGFIEARLPSKHAPTLFARYGNILSLGFALFLLLIGIALRRRLG